MEIIICYSSARMVFQKDRDRCCPDKIVPVREYLRLETSGKGRTITTNQEAKPEEPSPPPKPRPVPTDPEDKMSAKKLTIEFIACFANCINDQLFIRHKSDGNDDNKLLEMLGLAGKVSPKLSKLVDAFRSSHELAEREGIIDRINKEFGLPAGKIIAYFMTKRDHEIALLLTVEKIENLKTSSCEIPGPEKELMIIDASGDYPEFIRPPKSENSVDLSTVVINRTEVEKNADNIWSLLQSVPDAEILMDSIIKNGLDRSKLPLSARIMWKPLILNMTAGMKELAESEERKEWKNKGTRKIFVDLVREQLSLLSKEWGSGRAVKKNEIAGSLFKSSVAQEMTRIAVKQCISEFHDIDGADIAEMLSFLAALKQKDSPVYALLAACVSEIGIKSGQNEGIRQYKEFGDYFAAYIKILDLIYEKAKTKKLVGEVPSLSSLSAKKAPETECASVIQKMLNGLGALDRPVIRQLSKEVFDEIFGRCKKKEEKEVPKKRERKFNLIPPDLA